MGLIDISKDLFQTPPYPGDPVPSRDIVRRMELGDVCNLSGFYTGCHSATHMDAPRHFVETGDTIEKVDLNRCVGPCAVIEFDGILTGADIDALPSDCEKRLIIKGNGNAFFSQSAAFAAARAGFLLIGTDAQSIGAPSNEQQPHVELLSAGIPILEGLNLSEVAPGNYRLIALPLLLGGAEAAPVRAALETD